MPGVLFRQKSKSGNGSQGFFYLLYQRIYDGLYVIPYFLNVDIHTSSFHHFYLIFPSSLLFDVS
jgi:hypothetical protein